MRKHSGGFKPDTPTLNEIWRPALNQQVEKKVEALEQEVGELRARIDKVAVERELVSILYRYAHYLDSAREEEWLDLFTDDAVLDVQRRIPSAINHPHKHVGRQELRDFVSHHSTVAAPPNSYSKHFYTAPLISINGDEATVEQYAAGLDDTLDGPVLGRFGRTIDKFVRQDGRWRIKEHRIITDVARL